MRRAYGRYALGAFNVSNLEQIHGLFRGASAAKAPVIVQFTRVMLQYAHAEMLEHLLQAAEVVYPEVAFAVHLDHGDEPACRQGVRTGRFGSVMIDASHLSFDDNVASTARVVEAAHDRGITVEAELGQLKGVEDEMSVDVKEAILTDPLRAADFVRQTGCDSLAVAVGTSHGAYKFAGNQRLHLDHLAAIQQRLPGFPLVLHGASAVPADEIRRINQSGGTLGAEASGVSPGELQEAIGLGVTKVNIGTDGRLIWTRVHREFFRDQPGEFSFMIPGQAYMHEYGVFVEQKCIQLGAAGRAGEADTCRFVGRPA